MAKQNKPEQLELFDVDPICQQHGCMHQRHFMSIRELQALNEKLEDALQKIANTKQASQFATYEQEIAMAALGENDGS